MNTREGWDILDYYIYAINGPYATNTIFFKGTLPEAKIKCRQLLADLDAGWLGKVVYGGRVIYSEEKR